MQLNAVKCYYLYFKKPLSFFLTQRFKKKKKKKHDHIFLRTQLGKKKGKMHLFNKDMISQKKKKKKKKKDDFLSHVLAVSNWNMFLFFIFILQSGANI